MNIYVIYKFVDKDAVDAKCEELRAKFDDVGICRLTKESPLLGWKLRATTLMKQADIVVYFAGNEFSNNIRFELKLARNNKLSVFIVPLGNGDCLSKEKFPKLCDAHTFYGKKATSLKQGFTERTFADFCKEVANKKTELQNKLFRQPDTQDKTALLEQYKLMLETSETLVERRQKVSNVNITVCGILVSLVTSFLASSNIYMTVVAPIICMLIWLLCATWLQTILYYGKLNAAKFEIIENIENKLPLSVFGSEWIALSKRGKKGKRYVSFTQREQVLPKIFILLSALLFCASIALFVLRYKKII